LFFILVALVMFQSSNVVLAATGPSSWAQEEVNQARGKGLILPSADSNYQGNISRELFCMQIVNMVETTLGTPVSVTITNPFQDVNNEYVTKAYQLGIVNGVSATEFAPLSSITRQEIAAMMMRSARVLDQLAGKSYSDVSGSESITFADQDDIAAWALADIRIANSLDIMRGVGNNRVDPNGKTTVEQSILLVNRLYDGFIAAPTTGTGTVIETEPETEPESPENTAPTALANPVQFSVSEQTVLMIEADQLASDIDGDVLTVVAINGQTLPYSTTYGTAELTTDGKISYVSDDITANLMDDFVVTVSDGTAMTHINIRVNLTYSLVLILKPTIGSVSVTGNPVIGQTVNTGMIMYFGGVPSPAATLSYQWMISSTAGGTYVNIASATSSSYQPVINDEGKYLKLKVTASGSAGGSATSAAIGPVTYAFAGGTGIATDPYQIATATQFMLLNTIPTSNKYFKLTSNITLEENDYISSDFYGTLYGYGNTVTVNISESTGNYVGLFAMTKSSASIISVIVAGDIASNYSCVGGISGRNDGMINMCSSSVSIGADDHVGGIVGFNTGNGTVTHCYSSAEIEANDYIGGIVGSNSGTVSRCSASGAGDVTAGAMAGGVVGKNLSSGIIIYCFSGISVFANGNEGGLVGWNEGIISESYSTGSVTGYNNIGGLLGYNNGGTVSSSYYDKDTSGRSDTGRGIPKTTTEMKTQSTYVGWNFTNIWSFTNGNYPSLR